MLGLGAIRARNSSHRNLDRHRLKRIAVADKAANHRHDLTDVASDPDRDEIESADSPVRRIEADPAGARDVDLRPGVGGAAGSPALAASTTGIRVATILSTLTPSNAIVRTMSLGSEGGQAAFIAR